MKLKIEYESKMVMPDEIKELLDVHILELNNAGGEMLEVYGAYLFYKIFSWFAERAEDL